MARTGKHWAWGLLAVVPILALVLLWTIALMRWPRSHVENESGYPLP
jgi:hypothetical protein